MPSVSAGAGKPNPRQSTPSNPNLPNSSGHSAKDQLSTEPSPAIISSSSNVTVHLLSRRFLGPMPENVAHSSEVQEKQRKIRDMRRKAVGKILGRPGDETIQGSFGTTDDRRGVSKVVHRIRVRRKNKHGEEVEEDVDLLQDSDEESGRFSKFKGKKKQKRKDVWIGESFDIGQEFAIPAGTDLHEGDGPTANGIDHEQSDHETDPSNRPAPSRGTTQDTFVTARTHPNDSSSMIANLDQDMDDSSPPLGRDDLAAERASTLSLPVNIRDSQDSSIQPLISNDPPRIHNQDEDASEGRDLVTPVKKAPGFKNRFRSAVKQSPGGSTELNSIASPIAKRAMTEPRARSKSVQFHANPVTQNGGNREPPRRGNKQPADPSEVLEREGSAVAGTSAGAVEETAEEEAMEGPTRVGSVIMRDRMLVRVGYHRKDGLKVLNEKTLRRDPTTRLDLFEEYVAVWRKGRVELYQDYKTPLRERITGHKQLCWTIALQPGRTSLSIFNPTDMTIALTTSASKLDADVNRILKSRSTIHGALKDAVKQSRQYRWLQRFGKSGSHVFIIKISERTRAADWFWELWRDLGGELPQRLDIQIPQLGTSVRLAIPEDPEEVGGRETLDILNPGTVIDTCWEMLEGIYDHDKVGRDADVGLAWKTEDGRLDWLAFDTTVQGHPRRWAILVGMARQNPDTVMALQARRARHQPIWAKLEDGTITQEPVGIEGFLTRQKTTAAPRENVYIATHDGNVFTTHIQNAHPPLQPGKQQSLPRDVFPELHEAHLDSERQRVALFLQQSTGCVDLRDLEAIKLVSELEGEQSTTEKDRHTFEIQLTTGEKARFEAHSPEIAKEWVERLTKLTEYWKRRHRIDARERMGIAKVQAAGDTFTGSEMSIGSDEALGEIWDWCPLKGCRPVTYAGRIYTKKSPYEKYRLRYVVITGGSIVTFKIKRKQAFNQRKKVYSLFGSYCYSGHLAHDELHEQADGDAFASHPRVYHDGLNSADGIEDTTFCLRLPSTASTWGGKSYYSWDEGSGHIPPLSKKAPALLFFRARSSLERDKWVWALNAEKERMVRSHVGLEERLRNHDKVPEN